MKKNYIQKTLFLSMLALAIPATSTAHFSNPFDDNAVVAHEPLPVAQTAQKINEAVARPKAKTTNRNAKKQNTTSATKTPDAYVNVTTTVRSSPSSTSNRSSNRKALEEIEAIFAVPVTQAPVVAPLKKPVAGAAPAPISKSVVGSNLQQIQQQLADSANQRKLALEEAERAAKQAKIDARNKDKELRKFRVELQEQEAQDIRDAEIAQRQAIKAERERIKREKIEAKERIRHEKQLAIQAAAAAEAQRQADIKAAAQAKLEAEKAALAAQAEKAEADRLAAQALLLAQAVQAEKEKAEKIKAELAAKARQDAEIAAAKAKQDAEIAAAKAKQDAEIAAQVAREKQEADRIAAATKIRMSQGRSLSLASSGGVDAPVKVAEQATYGSRATQSALQRATAKLAVDPSRMPLRNRVLGFTASEAQVKALNARYTIDPNKVPIVPRQVGTVQLLEVARLAGDSIAIFKNNTDKRLVEEYLSYSPLHAQIFSNYVKRIITLEEGRTGSIGEKVTVDTAIMNELAYSFGTTPIPSVKLSEAQDKYLYIVSRLNEDDQVKFWNWVNTIKVGDEVNVPAWIRLADALYSN